MRALLLVLALACTGPAAAQTLTVEGGRLDGLTLASGIRAWLGVPFAAPPVRELRWRPPQSAKPWTGVFHADRFAPMCLQPLRSRTMNHYFGEEAISEDCLYLNVWAPARPAPKGRPYPVVVWIYGGAFNVGSASMANYDGARLAEKGVVRVNLAYRVGALGFLSHPELTREGGGASGDYGLMDQIAGLKWVQRNISAFGGDPRSVTIVGQSAGSMSVALLQQSPLARGLFHRVVGMSGSPFGELLSPIPLKDAEAQGLELQKVLGAHSLEEMRDLPGDRVLAAQVRRDPVVIDGRVITAAPEQVFAAHAQSDVPIMIGFTRDESFRPLGRPHDVAEYQALVRKAFPRTADAILEAYPVSTDAEVGRAVADLQRDATVGRQMAEWARAQARFGKSAAYVWRFERRQPYAPGIRFIDHDPATAGAYHAGDVPYWFRTLGSLNLFRKTRLWEPGDQRLSEDMSDMLVAFARRGAPSPAWPAFDPARPRIMRLGFDGGAIEWPRYSALDLLDATAPSREPATAAGRPRD